MSLNKEENGRAVAIEELEKLIESLKEDAVFPSYKVIMKLIYIHELLGGNYKTPEEWMDELK